jgi:hypothetical protein
MADNPGMLRTMYTPPDAAGNARPHAPDYHAEITAEKIIGELESSIISISPTSTSLQAGRDLRKKIEKVLTAHHERVDTHESGKLQEGGATRANLAMAHDDSNEVLSDGDVSDLLAGIAEAAKGTPFEALFTRDDVREAITRELHHETRSQMHIHRHVFKSNAERQNKPRLVSP